MKNKTFMLAAAVVLSLFSTGCTESDDLTDITPSKQSQIQQGEEEPLSDEFSKKLSAIKGITDVVVEEKENEKTGEVNRFYTFNCSQFIDHSDMSKGTFYQRVRIRLNQGKNMKAPVVLMTHGYSMPDTIDAYIPEIAKYLNATTVSVEHRYFGKSLPEPFENLEFTYLNAEQAANDLHLIITMLKQEVLNESGKWVSTGVSKDGITTALYAYYSDPANRHYNNVGRWNDIDLYMPFCAPFLEGTPTSCDDPKIGQYLYNECGKGYAAGSVEEKAYQNLRKIPKAILQNKTLRDLCLIMYNKVATNNYLSVIKEFGRDEEKATAGIMETYFGNLFDKMSYVPFKSLASMVPDVDAALAPASNDVEKGEKILLKAQLAKFIFMDAQKVIDALNADNDNYNEGDNEGEGDGDDDGDDDGANARKAALRKPYTYTDAELLNLRGEDFTMPYYVQAARELGNIRMDFSVLNGLNYPGYTSDFGFLTASVSRQFETSTYYKRYAHQWDGGKLMKSFRQWVKTQNNYNMIFCYSQNDAWTGGAIDASTNPKVCRFICRDGYHSDGFLDEKQYSVAEKNALLGYVKNYLGL
jgi:hypothetical protein